VKGLLTAVTLAAAAALVLLATPSARADEGWLGVVFADQSVELSAEAAGTVAAYHARLGDFVRTGQPVVALESEELRSARAGSQAALDAARARAEKADAELGDATRMVERRREAPDLFSSEEIAKLESRHRVAEAELAAARSAVAEREAALQEIERQLGGMTLRAPFDGSVALCLREVGDRVATGEALVRLISRGDPWIRFAVPSSEAAGLAAGGAVRVTLPGGAQSWSAQVRRMAPEIDPATDMIFAEAVLMLDEGEAGPRAGEVVRVRPGK
jgi:membrane fusion protein (multidrug efflux system)/multidrug efflux system membrane fusion protein